MHSEAASCIFQLLFSEYCHNGKNKCTVYHVIKALKMPPPVLANENWNFLPGKICLHIPNYS